MLRIVSEREPADKPLEREKLLNQAVGLLAEALRLSPTPDDFFEEERQLSRDLCEIGRRVTQAGLLRRAACAPAEVQIDGQAYRRGRSGVAQVLTPYGPVDIPRPLYRPLPDDPTAPSQGLLELSCGISEQMTPRMAALTGAFEAAVPSREAHALMTQAGLHPPCRAALERKAGQLGLHLTQLLPQALDTHRQQASLPEGTCALILGIDRIAVPYEEVIPKGQKSLKTREKRKHCPYERTPPPPIQRAYHMDWGGQVTFLDKDGESLDTWRYAAPWFTHGEEVVRQMSEDVRWALSQQPRLGVGICQDGARDLWKLMEKGLESAGVSGQTKVYGVVDWYHFWPYADQAGRAALYWTVSLRESWEHRLKHEPGALEEFLRALENPPQKLRVDWRLKAVKALRSYVEDRDGRPKSDNSGELSLSRFEYAIQRQAGLPIGSGHIEATVKTLVEVRMKRSGMRWSPHGAHALQTLRALSLTPSRFHTAFQVFYQSIKQRVTYTTHPQNDCEPVQAVA